MTLRPVHACLAVLALLPLVRAADQSATAGPKAPLVPTEIESGAAEMISSEKETTFTFSKGVTVNATNLKLTCDDLVAIALRSGDPKATIGKQEQFKSLVATGHVRIVQNDREATCERAEIFPGDNKVVLTGNPKVRSLDGQYQASGYAMELLRGERRARIIAGPNERPRITLPELKDLGYDKEKPKVAPKPGTAPEAKTAPATAEGASTPVITVPLPAAPK